MKKDFIFRGDVNELDPDIANLLELESQRQRDTIILIASESEAPAAVSQTLSSDFGNVYAEGYPREASRKQSQEEILNIDYEVARYRRHSDPRYYKGVEYADVLEALTRRRAAELFAANGVDPDDIYVNVQPLSGGPANSQVYTALIKPGDTILGLQLSDGGHLSHGAFVNRSGQVYKSYQYVVDPEREALDYAAIEKLAIECQPDIIVAGFSAYPLTIDWKRFRKIADKVGALLHADISHISGLVASGVHPSPMGIADTIMTTTHKSLCGPRGAMIMTHRKAFSPKIDKAVFPGEQGGPHLNKMAALAIALKLARSDQFLELQKRIVKNAKRLAKKLQEHGLRIVFGGSDNHLLLIDCKSVRVDGVPLTGDMAARILDVAGIVINRNQIPGDRSAVNPFGLRLGTVWISQLGYGNKEIDMLAEAIASVLKGCTPFYYRNSKNSKDFRAKIDLAALQHGRNLVRELTTMTAGEKRSKLLAMTDTYQIHGKEATQFCNYVFGSNVLALADGEQQQSSATLAQTADNLDIPRAISLMRIDANTYHFRAKTAEDALAISHWCADLSDGYVQFGDTHARIPGPVVITAMSNDHLEAPTLAKAEASKPFAIGNALAISANKLPVFSWDAPESDDLKRTALYDTHVKLSGKMVGFGGYDMPVWYTSVSEEHDAVRQTAGLFDVTHMGVFEASGPTAADFLHTVTTNDVHNLRVGSSQYAFLLAADGRIIDDLLIYRRAKDKFMVVVNAANNDEDWAWLTAVNEGEVCIDEKRPFAKIQTPCTLRDLRDPINDKDCLVDIALQGPKAKDILLSMITDDAFAASVSKLKWGQLAEGKIGRTAVLISRTGYTGERIAYEIFVHPDKVVSFWKKLLKDGKSFGIMPCGLASRDSTRTEAGLPLHGHELAGPFNINMYEAGFGNFVKLYKPFFIGRTTCLANQDRERVVVRFRMNDKGVRRPETGDPLLDRRGKVIGHVTSCSIDKNETLLGLAIVPTSMRKKGTQLEIYQLGGGSRDLKLPKSLDLGARFPRPDEATVLTRFP